ncbi:MAG TPA: ATP-binding protein [Streptosporangiaceae bacterium]|jgi:anti-sigma regulatory factor (Ser/Thr protein kinase)|nr:ATP-binding protein [Streptosporangiaceae bacterium]
MITEARRLLGVSEYAATPQQVSFAKSWIRNVLADRVAQDTIFDVSLCVVELVDNARKHGPADGLITVALYMNADVIRVEVTDGGSPETVPRVTDNWLTEDGHGLKIVSEVAEQWGSHQDPDLNRVVWCEFLKKG